MLISVDYADVDGDKPPTFAAAWRAGVRIVITRADTIAKRDAAAIAAAGMVRGVYLAPAFHVNDNPIAVVETYAAVAGLIPFVDLPPILDIEFPKGIAGTGRTRAGVMADIRLYVAAFRTKYGVEPILYDSGRVWDSTDTDTLAAPDAPDLVGCPQWVARYAVPYHVSPQLDHEPAEPPVPHPWGARNWWLDQFQGDARGMAGFSSSVDLSRFNTASAGEDVCAPRINWIRAKLGLVSTGMWDSDLTDALVAFQRSKNLTSDGIVGPRTFVALCWLPIA